jgi:Ankyrin repeats (many copies)
MRWILQVERPCITHVNSTRLIKSHCCCLKGHTQTFWCVDVLQRTPLHYAAKYRASEQVLTSLIKHRPSVCYNLDHLGRRAFDYAVGRAVTIMVKHEPSLLQVTNAVAATLMRTPLHAACNWPANSGSRFKASRIARIHLLLSRVDRKKIQVVDRNGQLLLFILQ